MLARVQGLEGVSGKVGYFESAKYTDGTPVASIAAVHEFGYAEGKIPPRPTMRPTIAKKSGEWSKNFGGGAKAIAAGTMTATQVMEAVGMAAAGDVRKTIAELKAPPLKEATIDRRKRRYADKNTTGNLAKPLVDTAVMVNAVTHLTEKTK
jgi:hypothetical protein